jgi:hypothetical protein
MKIQRVNMKAYKLILASAFFVIVFQTCSSHIEITNAKAGYSSPAHASFISRCPLDGFDITRVQHEVVDIAQPFIVRTVFGRVIATEEDSGWGEGVLFQVRAIDNKGKIFQTLADGNGVFKINGLPEGQYCFMASILGWKTYMGVIIINKSASPKNQIVFTMHIDT